MMDTDNDDDGILNDADNCVDVPNDDQLDDDMDGVGNWCDDEVIDDGTYLYVPFGTIYDLEDVHCYIEARIYGTLRVPAIAIGSTGVLALQADRILVAAGGSIDANAAGELGGAPGSASLGGHGGDGPGAACGGGVGQSVGQGGSGAGYGGTGGMPDNPYMVGNPCDVCDDAAIAHCAGAVGAVYGTDSGSDIAVGSGGGAAGNSLGCNDSGGRGGNGGGSITLVASETVTIDGDVTAIGEEPPVDLSDCGYRAGGGGGSGGGIVIATPELLGAASGSIAARGGNGGDSPGDSGNTWGWGGGGGGGGRVKVFTPSSSFGGTIAVDGGSGGEVPPADPDSYPGDPGLSGVAASGDEVPPELGMLVCP